jgi:hypothetical protein
MEVVNDIENKVRDYKGNNPFIVSLQMGLSKYGRLTPAQETAAVNFFVRLMKNKENNLQPKIEPIDVNVEIKVTKFIAKKMKEENNLEFRPHHITVSKIVGKSNKAFKLVGKMSMADVSSCRCCGRDLTDWRSQATGVGPVCVKSIGIPYVTKMEDVETFKKILKIKIDKHGDITFWVPKSQILEGLKDLNEVV